MTVPNSHQCASMALAEAWVKKSECGWLLNINKVATEQDLEKNHYLEEVGQTIYQVAINIKYCPYCGSKLDDLNDTTVPSFEFYDFSRW